VGDIEYDDWMSDNDAVMWHIERDPLLRSTITTVWLLDQAPDPERFDATLARSVAAIPRLRQRVVSDRSGVAPPKWEADPLFDPGYHIRQGRVGGAGTERDLLDAAAPIAMQAFDKDRPLWELHLLAGMEGGRTAVIMKLHHAVSDGLGLVKMSASLIETERDPVDQSDPPDLDRTTARSSDAEHQRDAVRHRLETTARRTATGAAAAGRGMWDFVRDPIATSRSAADTAVSVARAVRPVSQPLSPIMTDRSMTYRFEAMHTSVDELKAAAKACDATLNDAYVAAMLGGLSRYHRHHDAPVDELRMTMPIDIRRQDSKGGAAGNVFAPARFAVPLGIDDPVERIRAVHELVLSEKAEPAYPRMSQVASGLFSLTPPVFTRITGSMLKAIDFVTSNVPGPPFPVYVSGAKVERNIPFGPLSGAGANLTLFSYDGNADIGINLDAAAVPDGDVFAACLQEGLDEVLAVG